MSTKKNPKIEFPLIKPISGQLKVHFDNANKCLLNRDYEGAYNELISMQRINPDDPNANHSLAVILRDKKPPEVIFQLLSRARNICPDNTTIWQSYTDLLVMNGHFDQALHQQQLIASADEVSVTAWMNLLILARKTRNSQSLLNASSKLLELEYKPVFVEDMKFSLSRNRATSYSTHIEKALLYVFSQKNIELQKYMPYALSFMMLKYHCQQSLNLDDLKKLNNDSLLYAILTSGVNVLPDFEVFQTHIRKKLLISALEFDDLENFSKLIQAIAIQGQLTGYVMPCSDRELEYLHKIESNYQQSKNPNLLLLLSMYQPLDVELVKRSLLDADKFCLEKYLKIFYFDQVVENNLREELMECSSISDEVSLAVKDMYEESPYPQWTSIDLLSTTAAQEAKRLSLHSQHLYSDSNIELLIAGCGTGRQASSIAYMFQDVQVKAIDISSTSLAYAKRKSIEYQLSNIEYYHKDILSLADSDEKYLMIASTGVLHHMSNPDEAFAILRSKLKPGGLMLIGLYSELARVSINDKRKKVRDLGIQPDQDGIRNFRQSELLNNNTDLISEDGMYKYLDFGYFSGCRDLFFHVKEHQMSIAWLKQVLLKNNLVFKGFTFQSETHLSRFKQQYSEKEAHLDLDLWEEYENENPDTFIEMYNFYCQCNVEVEPRAY